MGTVVKKKINPHELADSIRLGVSDTVFKTRFGLSPEQVQIATKKLVEKGFLEKSFLPEAWTCPNCGFAEPQKPKECSRCGLIPDKVKALRKDAAVVETEKEEPKESKPVQNRGRVIGIAAVSLAGLVLIASILIGNFKSDTSPKTKQIVYTQQELSAIQKILTEAKILDKQLASGVTFLEYGKAKNDFIRASTTFSTQVRQNPALTLILFAMEQHLGAAQTVWSGILKSKSEGFYFLAELPKDPNIGHFSQEIIDDGNRQGMSNEAIAKKIQQKHWSEFSRLISNFEANIQPK